MGSSLVLKIGKLEIWKSKGLQPYTGQIRWLGTNIVWSDSTRENFVNAYLTNSGVYSIVSYIADLGSNAPFAVYRVKDKKLLKRYKAWTGKNATPESIQKALLIKEKVFELDEAHPMNDILEKPNGWQSQSSFTANSIGYRLLTGERMWLIAKLDMGANEGKPFSLVNLPPQYMSVVGDGTMFGISGYELNMGVFTKFDKDSIVFNRKWTPEFGTAGQQLRGLSPLRSGTKDMDRFSAAQERSASMLESQGAAGVLYEKSGELTEEQAGTIKVKTNTEVLGKTNIGKVALFNGDFGYINFGLDTKSLGTEELENLSFKRLCNVYHVPYQIFDNSKSGNAKESSEFKKEMITMAVVPELSAIRDDWNEVAKLYKGTDIYVDFDISVYPEMQDDLEKTSNILDKCWFFSGDEKRVKMGADQTGEPMMQKFFIDSNKVDIESLDISAIDNALNSAIDQGGGDTLPAR